MKAGILLLLFFISFASYAQKEEIDLISLEFKGESVMQFSPSSPKGGSQLFYSKDKKKIIKKEDPEFATDKSLLMVKPCIRVFKPSSIFPNNTSFSITLETFEIINAVEIRTPIYCDENVGLRKIDKTVELQNSEIRLEHGESNSFLETLTITPKNSGSFAVYTLKFEQVMVEALLMKDLKLTISDGKKVN